MTRVSWDDCGSFGARLPAGMALAFVLLAQSCNYEQLLPQICCRVDHPRVDCPHLCVPRGRSSARGGPPCSCPLSKPDKSVLEHCRWIDCRWSLWTAAGRAAPRRFLTHCQGGVSLVSRQPPQSTMRPVSSAPSRVCGHGLSQNAQTRLSPCN